jgi:hypothetical protein
VHEKPANRKQTNKQTNKKLSELFDVPKKKSSAIPVRCINKNAATSQRDMRQSVAMKKIAIVSGTCGEEEKKKATKCCQNVAAML